MFKYGRMCRGAHRSVQYVYPGLEKHSENPLLAMAHFRAGVSLGAGGHIARRGTFTRRFPFTLPGPETGVFSMVKRGLVTFCNTKSIVDQTGGATRGRKPAFLVFKRPARPHNSPIQNRFTQENAKGA
jgi:hypothetical protein